MFQRDYILRMIEMAGDLMRRVRELMDELSQLKLLDDACRRSCGLPLETLDALSADSLMEMLGGMPRLLASELMYMRATALPQPLEDEENRLLKSFRLLTSLCDQAALCELRAPRAQELKLRLLPSLTAADLWQCAQFMSQGEAYADMEDAIFEAAARAVGTERLAVILEGAAMLRQAAHADGRALAFARTTSEELLLSADELEAMKNQPEGRPQ